MPEVLALRLEGVVGMAVLAMIGVPLVGALVALGDRVRTQPIAPSERSLRTDLTYLLLSPVSELLSRTLTTFGLLGCAFLVGRELDPGLLKGFGPVAQQPRWLIIVEMLVLGDLMFYWTHRLAHTVPWLWRFHAVHHSTDHMRWSAAMRTHPAEAYVNVLHMIPFFLLGFPVDALLPLLPIATVYAMVIHSDVHVSLGPLNHVFNSPAFHRWHHARDVTGAGTNFAGWFPIFDAIFGTYQLPDHPPPALGIDDEAMPQTCLGQLAYPFRPRRRTQRVLAPRPAFARLTRGAGLRPAAHSS